MINIEKNQRFSRSHIWHAQRSFYDKKGADAWAKEVPFYITSNPFIANAYAKIIISFIKDCRSQGICDTFYLVELGAGPGLFRHGKSLKLARSAFLLCYDRLH